MDATVNYDAATRKVTLDPSANLEKDTKSTATTVKGGTDGAKDKAGNPLAADKAWSFTTTDDATPPSVAENSPTDKEVPRETNVTATFSEDVDGVTANTFMLAKGPDEPTPTTKITSGTKVSYDPVTRMATLDPYGSSTSKLEKCQRYTAKVTSGVKDKAGNPAVETVWTFKTRGC